MVPPVALCLAGVALQKGVQGEQGESLRSEANFTKDDNSRQLLLRCSHVLTLQITCRCEIMPPSMSDLAELECDPPLLCFVQVCNVCPRMLSGWIAL